MANNDDDDDNQSGGGFDAEVLKSYVSFVRRAVRERKLLAGLLLMTGLVMTGLAFKFLPRTYNCTTVLLAEGNQVLDDRNGSNSLAAATEMIMRHENLEAIVRELGLAKKFYERRPPLLKQKDRLITALFGDFSDEIKVQIVAGVLESRLTAEVRGSTLEVGVNWTDPQTTAEVAAAARDGFVKSRHASEMSAFQEKLAILDGHAVKLREEIETVALQIRSLRESKTAQMVKDAAPAEAAAAPPATRGAPRQARRAELDPAPASDPNDPVRKESLEAKKRKLAELEGDRERRLREERGKIAELKLRLTPNHPDVLTAEQRLSILSQEPSEVALLRAEVTNLEAEIKQRDLLARRGPSSIARAAASGVAGATPTLEALPTDIVGLLNDSEVDPALSAQLYSAIAKYSMLRDQMRNGRIELDTAQAAFNHRYKIIVPTEVPGSPVKPKASVVIGAGLAVSLTLALLLPILAALRTGIIMERWQVSLLNMPVLADLRLPPLSPEAGGDGDGRPR